MTARYGVAGYWIDFAVAHPTQPGRMLLAIEADGPLSTRPPAPETATGYAKNTRTARLDVLDLRAIRIRNP